MCDGTWKKCNYFRGVKMTFITMESKWFFVWCNVYLQQFRFTTLYQESNKSQWACDQNTPGSPKNEGKSGRSFWWWWASNVSVVHRLVVECQGHWGPILQKDFMSAFMSHVHEQWEDDFRLSSGSRYPGKNSRIRAMPYAGYAVYTACGFM